MKKGSSSVHLVFLFFFFACAMLSCFSRSDSLQSYGLLPPGFSVHGILQARILEWIAMGDLPNPGIKPEFLMSPAFAGGFFTTSMTWEASFLPTNMNFTKCFSMTAFLVAE